MSDKESEMCYTVVILYTLPCASVCVIQGYASQTHKYTHTHTQTKRPSEDVNGVIRWDALVQRCQLVGAH